MSAARDIHYYPLGQAVGYLLLGVILAGGTGFLLVAGFRGLWFLLGFLLGVVAVVLGLRSLVTRKKYPMTMGAAELKFYRRGREVSIPVQNLRRVWYNTSGIDKRVSIALADGSVVDIPVAYGLDVLRNSLQQRYHVSDK